MNPAEFGSGVASMAPAAPNRAMFWRGGLVPDGKYLCIFGVFAGRQD
jgi:hypothetical protein